MCGTESIKAHFLAQRGISDSTQFTSNKQPVAMWTHSSRPREHELVSAKDAQV